jgi:hypothetical protein
VIWTPEQKREAAVRAPMTRDLVREDTRVLEHLGFETLFRWSCYRLEG